VAWRRFDPVYLGALVGARRPPSSGAEDPRAAAPGAVYGYVVAHTPATAELARELGP
jgi:hypothetical protein